MRASRCHYWVTRDGILRRTRARFITTIMSETSFRPVKRRARNNRRRISFLFRGTSDAASSFPITRGRRHTTTPCRYRIVVRNRRRPPVVRDVIPVERNAIRSTRSISFYGLSSPPQTNGQVTPMSLRISVLLPPCAMTYSRFCFLPATFTRRL